MQNALKYMFNKKTLPIILAFVAIGVLYAFTSLGFGGGGRRPVTKYEKVLRGVRDILREAHYTPKKFDDAFSKEVFTKYLESIDPEKYFLLQQDIKLLKKFETKIDDEINGAPIQFFPAVSLAFNKRVQEAAIIYKDILAKPFSFTADEDVVLDNEKLQFPKDEAGMREAWRKKLKYLVLDRYDDLLRDRENNKGKPNYTAKSDTELEADARNAVMKVMDRLFDRYRNKFDDDEKFEIFVNVITNQFDPHTTYFPPVEKQAFDEQMSGRFYGIGAQLGEEDGNIKIAAITTGGPAWKSGELQNGDIIQKVAQGKEEPVELVGYTVPDAVKLIRGKKGTEVRLTVKKVDGTTKIITFIREEIVLDETFARSAIINGKHKLGYLYLPEFYADFDRPEGNRCSEDVRKELEKLKAEGVEGIVIDLRGNTGGSLYEVVQMVGLFIEDGPVVQVKDRDGKSSVLRDRDKSVVYDGPLTVMVDEFSASASEIFAAAIQDYKRGVVIGGATYGKGTVQRSIGLDPATNFSASNSELGAIKLTLQKFYRINGGSTQLRGVTPDISIPGRYDYLKLREKDNPSSLQWDEIEKANYVIWKGNVDMNTIRTRSLDRIKNNTSFTTLTEATTWLAKQNDKVFPLNLEKYRAERKQQSATSKQIEGLMKLQKELDAVPLPQEVNKYANDKMKQDRFNNWVKGIRSNIYIDESVNVLYDMIDISALTKKQ
jgi:carboxyl-terminal processing protease